ncbi:MAG: putative baseplate assembly protein [Deltaproteobacteria bacterium]
MLVGTQYRCDGDKRRDAVIASGTMNGIDYLEVVDTWAKTHPDSPRQRTLFVHLFKKPTLALDKSNVAITGGERLQVGVEWAYLYGEFPAGTLEADEQALIDALPDHDRVLVVRTTSSGDFSSYQLALVRSPYDARPPVGFDLKLSTVALYFKVECSSDFDCATVDSCPPALATEPEIDYLAKDWSSFRRLMLERMSSIMPDWQERHPADVGIVLVELLAYAGDHLSYYQDAVATEAYLGTARKRVSVRRHARLLDYSIDDGANARAWVALTWRGAAGVKLLRDKTRLCTRVPELPVVVKQTADAAARAASGGAIVFEPLEDLALDPGLNQLVLYTWGDDRCCLPKGATRATLDNTGNRLAGLAAGAVIVFGEVLSPETAQPEDADPMNRQAVRLTSVTAGEDSLFVEPGGVTPLRIVEVTWADEDALQRPLCAWQIEPLAKDHEGRVTLAAAARVPLVIEISAIDDAGQATAFKWSTEAGLATTFVDHAPTAGKYTDAATGIVATFTPPFDIGETFAFGPASIAWGNVVLVDHGVTISEPLPEIVEGEPYRPGLTQTPVTQAASYDPKAPATSASSWVPSDVSPAVTVSFAEEPGVVWSADRDLLEASAFEHAFVVETEDDGKTALRFGDGVAGREPDPGSHGVAIYRVGNGKQGNVGAEAIAHVVFDPAVAVTFDQIALVRNPLPARGGHEPETIDEVKLYAPQAFRTQQRAVTIDDYAQVAERHPEVIKAIATRRWTGSWYTIFLSVDRRGGLPIDGDFKAALGDFLESYRLAAQDLEIEEPSFVPLEIVLSVCVDERYYRADVKHALLEVFSNRDLPDGTRGFFHPDNFTFGQPVYLSQLVAAAMKVPGVKWVDPSPGASTFRRFWDGAVDVDLVAGAIAMSRLEVTRVDNDPNFPEHGQIDFAVMGGM